ncbi:uncharacterized protein JN550_009912 [Neoarthrinium moseri]|uniref:uncharacterized protein n=1 Tax=Neoarthrinium moseri TaxID=1658444 RepID=UPI001FDE19E7|nr:uncharacterized protein JN550_009912 [Neoarthrinium moseri]KAI1862765.1 hypothetical protein JN550_009912 [Neoarthrinium moseri]
MAASTSEVSPCFLSIIEMRRNNAINDEEYYYYGLVHLAGVVHVQDKTGTSEHEMALLHSDPFFYSIYNVSKEMEPVEDISPFMRLFGAYHTRNLEQMQAYHGSLHETQASYMRRLLAMRALWDERADVLRFCLQRGGFTYEKHFEERANLAESRSPELKAAMEGTRFRWENPFKPHVSAVFDAGGAHAVKW